MEDPDRLEDIHRSVASCTVLVYPVVSKNARSALFTVGTSTDLSRYLLPRSQDVSGKKRQAWQAASCSERSCRPVCSAQRGSEVQLCIRSSAPSRCLPSWLGTPRPTSPPNVPSLSGASVY